MRKGEFVCELEFQAARQPPGLADVVREITIEFENIPEAPVRALESTGAPRLAVAAMGFLPLAIGEKVLARHELLPGVLCRMMRSVPLVSVISRDRPQIAPYRADPAHRGPCTCAGVAHQ